VLVEPLAPALPLAAPLVLLSLGLVVVLSARRGAAARAAGGLRDRHARQAKKRRCDRGCKYFQVHRRTPKKWKGDGTAADKRAINVPASDKK